MTPTPTQALEPVEVSQAAREAAADYLILAHKADGMSDKLSRGITQPVRDGKCDSCDEVQAFARFERDTIERHRQSSNAASVGSFRDHLNAVLDTSGARGTYHALRYTEAVEAAERALASLSTPTAEPMADLQRLGQEYDGDALEGPFHVSRSSNGEKQWFSARDPAAGVTIPGNDRADAYALVAALNRSCAMFARRALSATPAPAVDETERLREAWPAGLTQALREILGIPNFQCGPMAHAYQKIGEFSGDDGLALDKRAEDEQAFILHKLIGLWFEHGDGWREPAIDEIDRAAKLARALSDRPQDEGEVK